MTPTGALNRWTWAPISVTPGKQTYAIAAFEVEYLYFHPRYAWRFAKSNSEGAKTTFCSFP